MHVKLGSLGGMPPQEILKIYALKWHVEAICSANA